MVLNCKERFKELLGIYEALFTGVKKPFGKKDTIDDFIVPEIVARYFMAEGASKWSEMLTRTEFVDLHPHSHIDIMHELLDAIIDSAFFRDHVSSLDDILAQLKSEREKKVALRESSLLTIVDIDAKISDFCEQIKALNKVEGVVDLDEEEYIVKSRAKRKNDEEEEEKRIESIKSLEQKKDILESKKKQMIHKINDVDEFLKNERPDKEVADIRLRGMQTRLCGWDRNGRLYWRLPVASANRLEGLLIESVIYFVHEDDTDSVQIVEEMPAQRKMEPPKKKKRKNEDEYSDLSSYNPSDVDFQSAVDASSEIMLGPDVCTVRLDVKSIFEYVDSHSTLMDLQNALNVNGLRESALKKSLRYFISEHQDALFSDKKDTFFNTFLDWILCRNLKTEQSGELYKKSALHIIHQILPYILLGLNLEVPKILPSDIQECLNICETFKDTSFYRNKQLYKELPSINTYSALIHWLQRAESYVAYLIQKEEIKEMRQEMKEARELSVSATSSRQASIQRGTDSASSEISRTRNQRKGPSKNGKSNRQKSKKSDQYRRSGRNVDRKDYTLKLEITSSESSESERESDSLNSKRRSQRFRLKKMRNIESSGNESEKETSSEDDLLVICFRLMI